MYYIESARTRCGQSAAFAKQSINAVVLLVVHCNAVLRDICDECLSYIYCCLRGGIMVLLIFCLCDNLLYKYTKIS